MISDVEPEALVSGGRRESARGGPEREGSRRQAVRSVAFFLPQFHPTTVNDTNWGAGFTEWHNVASARPRFRGHHQPVLPADLGFYDLRLAETRRDQATLASAHGVSAFAWYHYWFSGRRLLNEPFDRMFAASDEAFPFLLCWANEPWTRSWSGKSGQVIVPQAYSEEDDEAHIQWMLPVIADDRYVRVDGKSVVMVYQPLALPDAQRTTDRWRTIASDAGVGELLLLAVESFRGRVRDPRRLGFDGVVEQQPNLSVVRPRWRAALRYSAHRAHVAERYPETLRVPYRRVVEAALSRAAGAPANHYSTVCPGWDNSPRRSRGAVVVADASPEAYGDWVQRTLAVTKAPLLFVNAWNEWAEGAHLEPDRRHGLAFLEAHRSAVEAMVH